MAVPRLSLQQTLRPLYDWLDGNNAVVSSSVPSGSAVALTTGTPANVTSITLTEGDWTVFGAVGFLPAASTSITAFAGSSSTTSATIGALGTAFISTVAAVVPGASAQEFPYPTARVVVPAGQTVTVYLVARATFTVSTLGAYGIISARLMSK